MSLIPFHLFRRACCTSMHLFSTGSSRRQGLTMRTCRGSSRLFAKLVGSVLDERSSVEWLDLLLAGHPSVRRKLYSVVANVSDRHHGKMLGWFYDPYRKSAKPRNTRFRKLDLRMWHCKTFLRQIRWIHLQNYMLEKYFVKLWAMTGLSTSRMMMTSVFFIYLLLYIVSVGASFWRHPVLCPGRLCVRMIFHHEPFHVNKTPRQRKTNDKITPRSTRSTKKLRSQLIIDFFS